MLLEYYRALVDLFYSLIVAEVFDFEINPNILWKCEKKIIFFFKFLIFFFTYSFEIASFKIFCPILYGCSTNTKCFKFCPAICATSIAPAVARVSESITKNKMRAFSFARCSNSIKSGVHCDTCCKKIIKKKICTKKNKKNDCEVCAYEFRSMRHRSIFQTFHFLNLRLIDFPFNYSSHCYI